MMQSFDHARPRVSDASSWDRPNRTRHVFSVDVEEWYHAFRFYREPSSSDVSRLEIGLNRLIDMLGEVSANATFFWVGELAAQHPKLVQRLENAGHEIGCHSYSHAKMVYLQTAAEFESETRLCTDLLSNIAGRAVQSYRAPCFSITSRSLWAFDALVDLGLRYDSSVFPVKNWRYGIPDFPHTPSRVGHQKILWEIPISVRKFWRTALPVGGGAYFRIYPYAFTAANFMAAEDAGQFVVFYIHPWELDPDHPTVSAGKTATLTHYFNLKSTEAKLRQLLQDFDFGSLRDVMQEYEQARTGC